MNVITRVRGILLSPRREWRNIERESGEPGHLFLRYVAILALVPALFGFIGKSVIGVEVSAGTFRVPLAAGLIDAVLTYFFTFVIVYVTALVIELLAPVFQADRYFPNALKLAVYSFTPIWLSGVFLVLPGLRVLAMLGLYGIYLLWTGLPILLRAPRQTTSIYTALIAAGALMITILLAAIQGMIVAPQT